MLTLVQVSLRCVIALLEKGFSFGQKSLMMHLLLLKCRFSFVILNKFLFLFCQDDAKGDPQWSLEDVIAAEMEVGGVLINADHVEMMSRTSECVFEILERAWASIDCALIDMKIEFGVNTAGLF